MKLKIKFLTFNFYDTTLNCESNTFKPNILKLHFSYCLLEAFTDSTYCHCISFQMSYYKTIECDTNLLY